jgi:hypothetical protein
MHRFQSSEQSEQAARRRVQVGVRFEPDVLERLRNAVFWIDRGLTVTGVVEEAALEALEREHNGGEPFPDRTAELPKSKKR